MLPEDGLAVGVDFAKSDGSESSPSGCEGEPPDSREEVEVRKFIHLASRTDFILHPAGEFFHDFLLGFFPSLIGVDEPESLLEISVV